MITVCLQGKNKKTFLKEKKKRLPYSGAAVKKEILDFNLDCIKSLGQIVYDVINVFHAD